ncbi:transposase [Crocinitomix catalasitica]|nr:transposase [Crocinitomix catalasitica]
MKQGVKHTIKENSSYYLTLTVVDWVDVFTRKNHKDAIVDSLRYCIKEKGLNVYAYCLMSNHLHLIVNCDEPFQLRDVMRDFKKFTSKKIISQIQNQPESRKKWMLNIFMGQAAASAKHSSFKFWQAGNHAIELFSEKFVWDKINYIHNNPVEEKFVNKPEDWKYSSASNYLDDASVLPEVYCLAPILTTI